MQYNQSVSCLKQLTRVSHAACVPRVILYLRFNQHLAQAQEKTCNYALPGLAQRITQLLSLCFSGLNSLLTHTGFSSLSCSLGSFIQPSGPARQYERPLLCYVKLNSIQTNFKCPESLKLVSKWDLNSM